ncbi:MAG TPA: hypothetical protein VMZ91_16455, partial [Candidatus Paceibacterota bacterium]|nr:hypothetical protein [Candidatus Paceibacterota bacterium]
VEWKDITFYAGHYYIKDVKDFGLKKFKTIGYLIENNKNYIALSMGLETTEEDKCVDFIKIPKGNVIRIKELKGGKKNGIKRLC